MTAMRSATLIASSWSCVTRMVVRPSWRCRRLTSICMSSLQVAVEGGERLVEQQDRRLDGERPGQRHALLLAARELARQALAEGAELDHVEHAVDAPSDLGAALAAGAQPIGHVLDHRHVREEGVVLEDDADIALVGRQMVDAGAVDQHAAAGLADEARDDAQQGGLAAAGGAEQGHDLARLDGERHAVDGDGRAVADREIVDVQGSPGGRDLR